MKSNHKLVLLAVSLLSAVWRAGTVEYEPYTSFGGGDGWLAPGEGVILSSERQQRTRDAYGNGHVYLVSRNGRKFCSYTRSKHRCGPWLSNMTGVSGGTFAVNNIAVGGDGVIYVANLTTQSTTTPYKVYAWANEAQLPVWPTVETEVLPPHDLATI